MIIYKVTNLINGKLYIGQTSKCIDGRKKSHYFDRKTNTYFHKSLRKYGSDNFKWEVLYECNDKLLLNLMETFKIIVHHSHISEGGYNMTWGGEAPNGYVFTDDVKEKIRIKAFGRKATVETKKKMSDAQKGKYVSQETKLKQRINNIGSNNPFYGKKHSDETKKKMSQNNKKMMLGKKHTKGTKEKMSELHKGDKNSFYGKKHSDETKKKMSEKAMIREEQKRILKSMG